MQNKRGISQALSRLPGGIALRPATVFDVFDISRVLIRSITQLCVADHSNDPDHLKEWTTNKDPETIRGWFKSGSQIWVAEHEGRVAAVGGLFETGKITLLYVDPGHVGSGVGAALLNRLEQQLAACGCTEAHLDATRTARKFYLRHGWEDTGRCSDRQDLSCLAMRKSLHPDD
ncbi:MULTISPECIES: GNAT family N-acetyltransferase [unclassified Ruegeria]|uniref:GNAT family N-acetyltransferase n=1 Tax=unclassified Ruegeria TaxID=2625375 RepID=UPI00149280C6|nr:MULTISPECIES: GNAT family N-acetyltransferase [unclassified Ruegeria]NOE32201.1 GNAT family N-acetyltransferase [Ruegeria sp. HKCCD7318]